jgi:putative ABC transport system ATP-binding protein
MADLMELVEIGKMHPNGDGTELFSGITAVVEASSAIAVLGASGQGKSTLLRIMARLEEADRGGLRLLGRPSGEWPPREWRKQASYVAQYASMLPGSVEDNLRTASRIHAQPFDRALAERLMEQAGLGAMSWSKSADELSGGEKQRVALVRSLLLRPRLLLLDEVTASLDTGNKHAVEGMLREWHEQEGTALVWITHEPEQARRVCRRVWFLAAGGLREDAEAEAFFSRPSTPEAQAYLEGGRKGGDGECPSSL